MNKETAVALVSNFLERCSQDPALARAITSLEREALKLALAALQGGDASAQTTRPEPVAPLVPPSASPLPSAATGRLAQPEQPEAPAPKPPAPRTPAAVKLNLASLEAPATTTPDVLLCLDFGTAMSKAFATRQSNQHLDLELGVASGGRGYAVPSSVFIADEGKVYFGFEAIEKSRDLERSDRQRLDSIKGWFNLSSDGVEGVEVRVLDPKMNPTAPRLTEGDLLRLYLAFLTDVAESALESRGVAHPRLVRRRFARPCWKPDVAKSAEGLMRRMLADAQILADTFRGRWQGGIPVEELKSAVDQVKALPRRPDHLIGEGVLEPVAVAGGLFEDSENTRDAFMVVDAGAGTTDFGLFISTQRRDTFETCIHQVGDSVRGLMAAGDKVDSLLRGFIAQRESIDPDDNTGKMILADLGRRIRSLKEALFSNGRLQYVLVDGTSGEITLDEFLSTDGVKRFSATLEAEFKKSLEAVDESWLRWLSMSGVYLNVVLTGGSSKLPMMRSLAQGVIEVKGYRILRRPVDAMPSWIDDMPKEFEVAYPQLAVAIGGAADDIPDTVMAPAVFAGGARPAVQTWAVN